MISYATPYLYQYRAAHVLKDPKMRCLTYIAYLFRYKGILVLDSLDYKTRQNSSIRFTSFPYRLLIGHLLQELRNPFYSHIRNRRHLNRNVIFLSYSYLRQDIYSRTYGILFIIFIYKDLRTLNYIPQTFTVSFSSNTAQIISLTV